MSNDSNQSIIGSIEDPELKGSASPSEQITGGATIGDFLKGDPGKSAYEYAKDAGYTGTEAEFAEKLGSDPVTSWNDLTDKPFYTKDTSTLILSVPSILVTSLMGSVYGSTNISSVPTLVVGNTYLFNISGKKYEGVCTYNGSIYYIRSTENSNIYIELYGNIMGSTLRLHYTTPGGYSIALFKTDRINYPLDEKYIPDTIARVEDIPDSIPNPAIIDVIELPTENIQEDCFYRLMTGYLVFDQTVQTMYTVRCVESLPEVGEPATNIDNTAGNIYYLISDGGAYGYVDGTLSAGLGVPVGWYPAATLLGALGYEYAGAITNILDDPRDNKFRLLLEYITYSYKDGWTPNKTIGLAGTGASSEVFNHPSNIASGNCSHAEGFTSVASGDYSHAEGSHSQAEGDYSHAEGYDTSALGNYSHAEGECSHASGTRSHAEGYNSHAEGINSHVEGNYSRALGNCSHAEGDNSEASGNRSHAEGFASYAEGDDSHAEGNGTSALGNCSHAEGGSTTALGNRSHAEGGHSRALGDYSHAEGNGTTALGNFSHAEGIASHAEGIASHAEGGNSHAEGIASHAEGKGMYVSRTISGDANATTYTIDNTAGLIPGALVVYTDSNATYRTAKIISIDDTNNIINVSRTLYNAALTNKSVKIFVSGMALGDSSHSEGNETIAAGRSQHVQGEYNIVDPEYNVNDNTIRSKYAHIVGNGTSHDDRSNAHTLDWNGVPWYQGRPQFGGNSQDDGSQTVMANGDTEIILSSLNGTRFRITVNDDGLVTTTKVT